MRMLIVMLQQLPDVTSGNRSGGLIRGLLFCSRYLRGCFGSSARNGALTEAAVITGSPIMGPMSKGGRQPPPPEARAARLTPAICVVLGINLAADHFAKCLPMEAPRLVVRALTGCFATIDGVRRPLCPGLHAIRETNEDCFLHAHGAGVRTRENPVVALKYGNVQYPCTHACSTPPPIAHSLLLWGVHTFTCANTEFVPLSQLFDPAVAKAMFDRLSAEDLLYIRIRRDLLGVHALGIHAGPIML